MPNRNQTNPAHTVVIKKSGGIQKHKPTTHHITPHALPGSHSRVYLPSAQHHRAVSHTPRPVVHTQTFVPATAPRPVVHTQTFVPATAPRPVVHTQAFVPATAPRPVIHTQAFIPASSTPHAPTATMSATQTMARPRM